MLHVFTALTEYGWCREDGQLSVVWKATQNLTSHEHFEVQLLPSSAHLQLEWNQDRTVGKSWLVIIIVHMDIALKSGKCVAGADAVKCVESSPQLIVRSMAWDGYQTVHSFATWYPPTVSFPTESYGLSQTCQGTMSEEYRDYENSVSLQQHGRYTYVVKLTNPLKHQTRKFQAESVIKCPKEIRLKMLATFPEFLSETTTFSQQYYS